MTQADLAKATLLNEVVFANSYLNNVTPNGN